MPSIWSMLFGKKPADDPPKARQMTSHEVAMGVASYVAAIVISAGRVFAQTDHVLPPWTGTLAADGGGILNYQCSKLSEDRISCDFVQVLFYHRDPIDLSEGNIAEILKDAKSLDESICKVADQIKGFFATGAVSSNDASIPDDFYSAVKSDEFTFRGLAEAGSAFCAEKTAEKLRPVLEIFNEREARSCQMMFNKYQQTFKKVSDRMWVVESEPYGPCGLINTSHFALPDDQTGILWEMSASKIVKNPIGKTEFGIACSDLDERMTLYTWRKAIKPNCVFIQ